MTTLTQFDIEPLLAPIPGDRPAGEWLRFDAVYDDVRRLREADDPSLPQGVWKRELKRADWNGVAHCASEALASRTKDLQLAVWLAEAWLHIGGYRGFAAGMRLVAALCRTYWQGLHPPLEGDSVELRAAPLAWAADKLLFPIESVPVTSPEGEESVPLTWSDRRHALYYDNFEKNHPSEAASAYESGTVTHREFLISASLTRGEWFATLAKDAAEARAAVADAAAAFAEQAGADDTPSFALLLESLDAIGAFASRILAERVHGGELVPEPDGSFVEAPFETDDGVALAVGPVASRAAAFQRLREAAEFLLRTEPHSPVPYLVLRAISWEHMPLPELLAELLKNDLAAVYALLGLQQEPPMD